MRLQGKMLRNYWGMRRTEQDLILLTHKLLAFWEK